LCRERRADAGGTRSRQETPSRGALGHG
jgi:hypothetical protein